MAATVYCGMIRNIAQGIIIAERDDDDDDYDEVFSKCISETVCDILVTKQWRIIGNGYSMVQC